LAGKATVEAERKITSITEAYPHCPAARMRSTQVVARSPDERPQYFIKVSGEAGIGKTHLDYRDVEALAWRIDYPENR
jgi:hypothetical protein